MGKYLATHCMGMSTDVMTDDMVAQGQLDFIDGQWIADPLLILFARAVRDAQQG